MNKETLDEIFNWVLLLLMLCGLLIVFCFTAAFVNTAYNHLTKPNCSCEELSTINEENK